MVSLTQCRSVTFYGAQSRPPLLAGSQYGNNFYFGLTHFAQLTETQASGKEYNQWGCTIHGALFMRLAEAILKVRSYALCGQSEWHFLCPIQYLTPAPLRPAMATYLPEMVCQSPVATTRVRCHRGPRQRATGRHTQTPTYKGRGSQLTRYTTPPPSYNSRYSHLTCSSLDDSFPKYPRSRKFDKPCTIQASNVICCHRFKTGLTSCLFAFHHHSQLELRELAPEAIYIMLLQ